MTQILKPEIAIVGVGPGPLSLLTREAEEQLLRPNRVFFRMSGHPVYHWLRERKDDVLAFDLIYQTPHAGYDDVYEFITAAILKESHRSGRVTYALPGHPFVGENTATLITERAAEEGVVVTVVPGLSFLDLVFAELRVDPVGIQICNALDFQSLDPGVSPSRPVLITAVMAHATPSHLSARNNVLAVARWLRDHFPPAHRVALVWTTGMPDYASCSRRVTVTEFEGECEKLHAAPFASLYVPALKPHWPITDH